MSIHYRQQNQKIFIIGHTYPHKESIKAIGARYDREHRVWMLDDDEPNLTKVKDLVARLGGTKVDVSQEPAQPPKNDEPNLLVKEKSWSVSELVSQAALSLTQRFPKAIWLIGEIQNLSDRPSGMFFSLAEPKQDGRSASLSVKATLWNSTLQTLTQKHKGLDKILEDGHKLRILCQVSMYKDRAQLSLNVLDIDPAYTQGALALAREELLRELRKKGLDRKNRSLRLGTFPLRIGLVSAEGSRAKSDFLDQLSANSYCGEIIFYSAPMQGEKLLAEIPEAIAALNKERCDLIVLTRGGGSAGDLRWFDTREVALAIANSQSPILCAIGHHDDVSVAELISFKHEKTPTAAAEFIVKHLRDSADRIDQLSQRIAAILELKVAELGELSARLKENLSHHATIRLLREERRQLDLAEALIRNYKESDGLRRDELTSFVKEIETEANAQLNRKELECANLENQLTKVDPRPWLEKGWTQLFDHQKRRILSTKNLTKGSKLKARLIDGELDLIVERNHK